MKTEIGRVQTLHSKLLISQSKFSGPRKFTLRYQYFGIKETEMKIKIGHVQTVYSKLLISQSKFSGPRNFTLRYQ